MASTAAIVTAERFASSDFGESPTELLRGRVVYLPFTTPRVGQICTRVAQLLGSYLEAHDIGRVVVGGTAVLTGRNPDTVRGADVAYYSYEKIAKGPLPGDYILDVPKLIFEVLSPSDRWSDVQEKVDEYLEAGVTAVCVVDYQHGSVHVFRSSQPKQTFKADDSFSLPDVLDEFTLSVDRFFQ